MNYRNLGRTGLKVSEVGFGAWAIGGNQFGNSYGPTDDETSLKAIQRALDLGCNFFDTADVYGHGHSEELLGKALKGYRDEVIIATKCGGNFYNYAIRPELQRQIEQVIGSSLSDFPPETVLPFTHDLNFSPDYIRFALEQSLKRLQTNYLDIYQLHNPPYELIREGSIFEVMHKLKEEGKIRFVGISIFEELEGLDAIRVGNVDVIQVAYNIFDQRPRRFLFPLAKQANVGIIAREPLANGFLTGKYSFDATFPPGDIRHDWSYDMIAARVEAANRLKFLVIDGQRTLSQAALRFVLAHDAVSVTIPGAKTPEQVEENMNASEAPPITDEEMRQIHQVLSR